MILIRISPRNMGMIWHLVIVHGELEAMAQCDDLTGRKIGFFHWPKWGEKVHLNHLIPEKCSKKLGVSLDVLGCEKKQKRE